MADDEELRIKALREEMMKEMQTVRTDVNDRLGGLETNVAVLKWLFLGIIAVFGLIATILALAANII